MSKFFTAEELDANAAEAAAIESFKRSHTDGFMSQWAGGRSAEKHRLNADIARKGGKMEFKALFDLDGNLIAAKKIQTQYGSAWAILSSQRSLQPVHRGVRQRIQDSQG